jgi:hypothetical protein
MTSKEAERSQDTATRRRLLAAPQPLSPVSRMTSDTSNSFTGSGASRLAPAGEGSKVACGRWVNEARQARQQARGKYWGHGH